MSKIALVSTYPPFKCGIATYQKKLAQALARGSEHRFFVVSEGGEPRGNGIEVRQAYRRQGDLFIPTHARSRWAAAMQRMIDQPNLRARISSSLREYAERTTWDAVARQHLELYDAI